MSKQKGSVLALVVLFLFLVVCGGFWSYGTQSTDTITFEKGERIVNRRSSYYLVWTKNQAGESEVFSVQDDAFHGHFRASDLYGSLKAGHTYNVKCTGKRIPFLSMYRNIYSAKEVSQD